MTHHIKYDEQFIKDTKNINEVRKPKNKIK